ncbi:hypothetical protein GCM10027432_17240 [Lysobacter fragariae]
MEKADSGPAKQERRRHQVESRDIDDGKQSLEFAFSAAVVNSEDPVTNTQCQLRDKRKNEDAFEEPMICH